MAVPAAVSNGIPTSRWNSFYSSWLEPLLIIAGIAALTLTVLLVLSGLFTPVLIEPRARAWPGRLRTSVFAAGLIYLLAVAAFLPVYPVFHPFDTGGWFFWVFTFAIALPGVAFVGLASLRLPTPVLPRAAAGVLLAVWGILMTWFYHWGTGQQLVAAYVALGVLGLTVTTVSLGQNQRLQVEASTAAGQVDSAATDYLLCRLQTLGSRPPEALSFSQTTDLSRLVSTDLTAIPDGAIAAAVARILYAVRPGLTWRARITVVDDNRLAVQLFRNSRLFENAVISRPDLKLPAVPADATDAQARAKAQLLTGAAACVLTNMAQVHSKLGEGLCGASEWKSVALHVIATEPALAETPDVNIQLLREAVNADPKYALGRLDYVIERYRQTTPKTAAVRQLFASFLDAQLPCTQNSDKPQGRRLRPGYEVMYLRILYNRAMMRLGICVLDLIECGQKREELLARHEPELRTARKQARRLVDACELLEAEKRGRGKHVQDYARRLHPLAADMQDTLGYLADKTYVCKHRPTVHGDLTPRIAMHNATRLCIEAGLGGNGANKFTEVITQLRFGIVTREDYAKVLDDPPFWLDGIRPGVVADKTGFGPPGMLDLPAFAPHAHALRQAGVTTFQRFRFRTASRDQQQDLATYLCTDLLVVAHLTDIANLALSFTEPLDADVLAVFIGTGITSKAELDGVISADRPALIANLRATAREQGKASLKPIKNLETWLPEPTPVRSNGQRPKGKTAAVLAATWAGIFH